MRHLISILLALIGGTVLAVEEPAALVPKLVPAAGWSAPEAPRSATGDDLFDLIDGGAELYHEYGFKRAAAWDLVGPAGGSIQVELYEMCDAPAAFGVWSLMQTGKFTRGALGQGSLRFGYYVAFWSGPYFASVTGAQPTPATQTEVDRLAAQLAALLPRDGALPAWCTRVPATGRQELKYFRGPIGLSNIATGLDSLPFTVRDGVFATYPGVQLLALRYADAATAKAELAKIDPSAPASLIVPNAVTESLEMMTFDNDLLVLRTTDEATKRAVLEQYAR